MTQTGQGLRKLRARWPLDPFEKTPRRRVLLLGLSAALLFMAALALGFLSLYCSTLYIVWARFATYFSYPALVALNLAPAVVFAAVFWLLTDRPWLAFLLDAVLVLSGTFVNFFKVVLRDDPLVFEDIAYFGEAAGVVGNYQVTFPRVFLYTIAACLLLTLGLLLCARGRIGHGKKGLLCRAAALLLVLALSWAGLRVFYFPQERYDSFENYKYFNRWQPAEDYASRGFLYPFLHSVPDALPQKPEGYSDRKAKAILAAQEESAIPEGKKVNVIAVMLESFSDLGALNYSEDPYARLRELERECLHGTMISDTLGGGTCNSERSFLTGSLYPQPDYRHDTWSYVHYFAGQGYHTEGGHPGFAWYYNRQVVDRNLGFMAYDFNENRYDALCEEEHAPDSVFFPALLERYRERDAAQPYFNFSVSYQGHGPYSGTELTRGREYLAPEGVSELTYCTVNNYLAGVADTLEQVSDLLDALREDEAPVVVLFFGDHKPTLGSGNSCYEELGISLERKTEQGFENYYSTRYLIWGNEAAKQALGRELSGEGPTVGPYFLMNVLFEACGWDGPAFLKISDALRETANVVHATKVFRVGDELAEQPSDGGKAEADFRLVQYYLRKKAYGSLN